MIECYQEKVSDGVIKKIEGPLRGQNNQCWREFKKNKLTASDFKAAVTPKSEPNKFLKQIMYKVSGRLSELALQYGHLNEK